MSAQAIDLSCVGPAHIIQFRVWRNARRWPGHGLFALNRPGLGVPQASM